jgi:hypothetical protein
MSESESMIIPVPKPETKVNKDRKINTLLQAQVRHLLDVEHKQMIARDRTGETKDLTPMSQQEIDEYLQSWTEGQAAAYIRKMTTKLHEINTKPKKTRRRKASPKSKSGS